jgi:hypothetical protein
MQHLPSPVPDAKPDPAAYSIFSLACMRMRSRLWKDMTVQGLDAPSLDGGLCVLSIWECCLQPMLSSATTSRIRICDSACFYLPCVMQHVGLGLMRRSLCCAVQAPDAAELGKQPFLVQLSM